MPNFDGTGPLKRGRVIGRGRGHCNLRNARNDSPLTPEEQSAGELNRDESRKEE